MWSYRGTPGVEFHGHWICCAANSYLIHGASTAIFRSSGFGMTDPVISMCIASEFGELANCLRCNILTSGSIHIDDLKIE